MLKILYNKPIFTIKDNGLVSMNNAKRNSAMMLYNSLKIDKHVDDCTNLF